MSIKEAKADIFVIGGGLAEAFAAIKAKEADTGKIACCYTYDETA